MNYLITTETEDGSFYGDPFFADDLDDARKIGMAERKKILDLSRDLAKKIGKPDNVHTGISVIIYRCSLVEYVGE